MKTTIRVILNFAFFLSIVQSANGQIVYSWNGGAGNWNVATNWTPNGVPTSLDNAIIAADGTYTVTLDIDASISELSIGGSSGTQALSLSGRTLTIGGNATVNSNGAISISNSILSGSGKLNNSGNLTAYNGTFDLDFDNAGSSTLTGSNVFNDTIITQPASTLILSSYSNVPYSLTSARGFTNNGILNCITNINSGGSLNISTGTLINDEQGTIHFTGVSSQYSSYLSAELDNQGTVIIDYKTIINKPSAVHTNSGNLTVRNMNLTIIQSGSGSGFTNTGTLTIDSLRTLTVTGGDFNYESGNLLVNGHLSISDATVNLPASYLNTGSINLANSILNCTSSFTNQGTLTLTGTTINGSDFFTNQSTLTTTTVVFNMGFDNAGAATFQGSSDFNDTLITRPASTMNISSYSNVPYSLTSARGFTNNGILNCITNINSGGSLNIGTGTLINDEQGTIHFTGVSSQYSGYLSAELDNQGTVIIDYKTIINKPSAVHTNSGNLTVRNMNLTIIQSGSGSGFTNTGTLTVDSLKTLTISGGYFDYNSGEFVLNGAFSASDATVNLTPAFINTSSINLTSSILNCTSSFANHGTLTLTGTTINGSDFFTNQSTLTTTTVVFNMDFDNAGVATFHGSSDFNDTLITRSASTMNISSYSNVPYKFTSARGFTNKGLILCKSYNYFGGGILTITDGILLNHAEGTIQFTGDQNNYTCALTAALENDGEIVFIHHTNINRASAEFMNRGSITVLQDRRIDFTGASFSNQSGGSLNGNGTIDVSKLAFTNSGIINPGASPGRLGLTGNLPQDSGSIINIELGGNVAVSSYDQLSISGSASLDGTLDVKLIDEFVPEVGDEFDIVLFASATNGFDKANGLYIGKGVILNLQQSATNIKLTTAAHTNRIPTTEKPLEDLLLNEDFEMVTIADLDSIFNDEDISLGDKLSYTYFLSNNLLGASMVDNILSISSLSDLNGSDTLIVTATDIDQAIATDTIIITINPVNDAPSDFNLLEPQHEQVLASADTIVFIWNSSTDIDEDLLVYELHITHPSWDTTISNIQDTMFRFINDSGLLFNTAYEWSVSVSDGSDNVTSLNSYSFTTPEEIISSITDNTINGFRLAQNFPNPFMQKTMIEFSIPTSEYVTLKIYDLEGREVAVLVSDRLIAGNYYYLWNAEGFTSGVYVYRIETGKFQQVKRMILAK